MAHIGEKARLRPARLHGLVARDFEVPNRLGETLPGLLDEGLRPPSLGDVGIHVDGAATGYRVSHNLKARAVAGHALAGVALAEPRHAFAHRGLDVDRTVVVLFRQKSDEIREITLAPQKLVGKADQCGELLVPRDHL